MRSAWRVTPEAEGGKRRELTVERRGGRVAVGLGTPLAAGEEAAVAVAYGGAPREAPMPPWDGGFVWERARGGRPWIGVACQLDGADLWWPTKDHPSDDLDEGADLHFTVPRKLVVVANGTLAGVEPAADGRQRTWHWHVASSINAYGITFNAGPFRAIERTVEGADGSRYPFTFWVLREDLRRGEELTTEILDQLAFLEETVGPYPFRGEKLGFVETPYVAMEHQTAIAHGKIWKLERLGVHFTALHELAHEWFGNLVTAGDWSDFWLHEGFASYLEALYVERRRGADAARLYLDRHFRPDVSNAKPLAPRQPRSLRDSFAPGFTDPYGKGAWVLHTLRWLVGDEAFFRALRRVPYPDPAAEAAGAPPPCRAETSDGVRRTFEAAAGRDLGWFFEVYLRQSALPRLDSTVDGGTLGLAWVAPDGLPFPLPVEVELPDGTRLRVEMPDGRAEVPWPYEQAPKIDPDHRLLREEGRVETTPAGR